VPGKYDPVTEIKDAEEPETELQRRLRSLDWPEPPPGARERGLEALRPHLKQLAQEGNGTGPTDPDD
jgi:hypothetical protein